MSLLVFLRRFLAATYSYFETLEHPGVFRCALEVCSCFDR